MSTECIYIFELPAVITSPCKVSYRSCNDGLLPKVLYSQRQYNYCQAKNIKLCADTLPSSTILVAYPSALSPRVDCPYGTTFRAATQGLAFPRSWTLGLFTLSSRKGVSVSRSRSEAPILAACRLQGHAAARGSPVTGRFHAAIVCRAQASTASVPRIAMSQ